MAALIAGLAASDGFTSIGQVELLQIGNAISLAAFFCAGVAAERFGWVRTPLSWRLGSAAVAVLLFA